MHEAFSPRHSAAEMHVAGSARNERRGGAHRKSPHARRAADRRSPTAKAEVRPWGRSRARTSARRVPPARARPTPCRDRQPAPFGARRMRVRSASHARAERVDSLSDSGGCPRFRFTAAEREARATSARDAARHCGLDWVGLDCVRPCRGDGRCGRPAAAAVVRSDSLGALPQRAGRTGFHSVPGAYPAAAPKPLPSSSWSRHCTAHGSGIPRTAAVWCSTRQRCPRAMYE
jgi:hypothetical protein